MAEKDPNRVTGVRPAYPGGRKRPSGGLQARMRALGAVGAARQADSADPQPECAHAIVEGRDVHCTCRDLLAGVGANSMMCIGKRCGYAELPRPSEKDEEG